MRHGVVAAGGALAAVVLAVLLVPVDQAEPPTTSPFPRTQRADLPTHSWPPRIVPTTPVADAVTAEDAPAAASVETTTTSAAPPPPTTTSVAPAPRPERIRALVPYPFEERAPGWTVTFEPPRQRGLLGLTDRDSQTITVYVSSDASDHELAFTLAHEMAHALDALHLTPDERADYRDLRDIPQELDWQWSWGADGDFAMPAGDFAEAFAVATVGDDTEWASRLGGPPDADVQQQLLALLDDD